MTAPSSPAPQQPVVEPDGSPADGPGEGAPPQHWPVLPARPGAKAFSKSDLPGAVTVLSMTALLGLPLAWLWSRLAPPQLSVVQADGSLAALPPESQHRFDDLALFVLLGIAAGVLSGVAVWLLRQRRGPLALLGLAVGSLVAAWLAMRTGVSFADGRYAAAIRAAGPDSVVSAAPRIESALVLVPQPLVAVLTYGFAAATNGLDDLGRRLS